MFKLKNFDLSDINTIDSIMDVLYDLFRKTLNESLTQREFRQYFFGKHPEKLEISFIHKGAEVAGFCTSAAYPRKLQGRKVVILRSAFGLLDRFKKGKFPLHGLFYKYMRYKLSHPFTPVYVAGFMANPLMYAMICKYTHSCYPRRGKPAPDKMKLFAKDLISSMNLERKMVNDFVVKIHFQVRFNEKDVERIEASTDKDVQYFLEINPGYRDQMGVMVLVPVSFSNIAYTFVRYMFRSWRKAFRKKRQPAVQRMAPVTE